MVGPYRNYHLIIEGLQTYRKSIMQGMANQASLIHMEKFQGLIEQGIVVRIP